MVVVMWHSAIRRGHRCEALTATGRYSLERRLISRQSLGSSTLSSLRSRPVSTCRASSSALGATSKQSQQRDNDHRGPDSPSHLQKSAPSPRRHRRQTNHTAKNTRHCPPVAHSAHNMTLLASTYRMVQANRIASKSYATSSAAAVRPQPSSPRQYYNNNSNNTGTKYDVKDVEILNVRSNVMQASSKSSQPTKDTPMEETQTLLHPQDLCNGTLPHPKSLSPSSIAEFLACPQSFLFQYIYNLKQPITTALVKGSMCHTALEQLFDLPKADRTLPHLQNLFRKAWSQERSEHLQLFSSKSDEIQWGKEGLKLLENYIHAEDPQQVEPAKREMWVKAQLSIDPRQGNTGYVMGFNDNNYLDRPIATTTTDPPSDRFLVRGIVDRLDLVRSQTASTDSDSSIHIANSDAMLENRATGDEVDGDPVVLQVIDYKTGKAPDLKYPPHVNRRILDDVFFQLQIYALLLREQQQDTVPDTLTSLDVRFLRLFYLTSHAGVAQSLEMDLGASKVERDRVLQDVHEKLASVWTDILQLVTQQDPRAFVGCDRKFCYCHKCRNKFVPGTVWEPNHK